VKLEFGGIMASKLGEFLYDDLSDVYIGGVTGVWVREQPILRDVKNAQVQPRDLI
jgi:hypothetical protein